MIAATRPWAGPPVSLTETEHPPDWRTRAACLGVDPELFYPLGEPGSKTYERAAEPARAVCRHCPVLVDCLEDALVIKDRWAIRGGLDPVERGQQFGVKRRKVRQASGISELGPVCGHAWLPPHVCGCLSGCPDCEEAGDGEE